MYIESLTLTNYRCFGETPTRLALHEALTAIVGPNGAGTRVSTAATLRLLRLMLAEPAIFEFLAARCEGAPAADFSRTCIARRQPTQEYRFATRRQGLHLHYGHQSHPMDPGRRTAGTPDRDVCVIRNRLSRSQRDRSTLCRQFDHVRQVGSVCLTRFEFEQNDRTGRQSISTIHSRRNRQPARRCELLLGVQQPCLAQFPRQIHGHRASTAPL